MNVKAEEKVAALRAKITDLQSQVKVMKESRRANQHVFTGHLGDMLTVWNSVSCLSMLYFFL